MNRVKTGIPGFDVLCSGGFVKGHNVLLSGGPGAGKTIFGLQYLLAGLKNKENGLFISFDESPESIKKNVESFGWKLDDKNLRIIKVDASNYAKTLREIKSLIESFGAKRLVIDSLTTLVLFLMRSEWRVSTRTGYSLYTPSEADLKRRLLDFMSEIKESGCTTVLTCELIEGQEGYSKDGISEFVADAVVVLQQVGIGEGTYMSLKIPKMRGTDQSKKVHAYKIDKDGLSVIKEKETEESIKID